MLLKTAGQGFPAFVVETLTRDNTSSRLIFPTTESYAKMAGLDGRYAKELLPVLENADRGTAILDVSILKEPFIIDIPFTTINDLVSILNANKMYSDLTRKFSSNIVDSIVSKEK